MKTEIALDRRWFSQTSTVGELLTPERRLLAFTLEDMHPTPYVNVPGKTCIPAGRYQLIRADSERFKPRKMLRFVDVPGRKGILIHEGNTEKDVIGCVAVGKARLLDKVLHSLDALEFVDFVLDGYLALGEVWCTVAGEPARQLVC